MDGYLTIHIIGANYCNCNNCLGADWLELMMMLVFVLKELRWIWKDLDNFFFIHLRWIDLLRLLIFANLNVGNSPLLTS